jgi:hypothetical protein
MRTGPRHVAFVGLGTQWLQRRRRAWVRSSGRRRLLRRWPSRLTSAHLNRAASRWLIPGQRLRGSQRLRAGRHPATGYLARQCRQRHAYLSCGLLLSMCVGAHLGLQQCKLLRG